jgi:predicted RNA binding protein YcfA (HicA-like mRNA interferase family)
MTYRDATRKLKKLGCYEIARKGGGDHRKWHNPVTNRTTTLPDWGSRDLKTGTLYAAVKQLGIAKDDFDRA